MEEKLEVEIIYYAIEAPFYFLVVFLRVQKIIPEDPFIGYGRDNIDVES